MRITCLILLIAIFYGCGGIKEAQKAADRQNCRSVVEAFYTTDTTYSTKPPFLLLKHDESFNDSRYLYGGIVSMNDSGIVFLRSKKTKFFPYEDIACLIDSNNQIAYGEWKRDPEVVWDVELICQRIDSVDSKLFSIILEENRVSSYYIEEPGEYEIIYIKFSYSDEYLDQSDTLFCSRFRVFDNAVTYLGTFHSEFKWNLTSDMKHIPTNIIKRKGMGAVPMITGGGLVGGLLGYLADQEIRERETRKAPLHGLKVTIDSSYKSLNYSHLKLMQSPVILDFNCFDQGLPINVSK